MTSNWSGGCSRDRRSKTPSGGRPPVTAPPDFAQIHQELNANKNVTLQLLWQELIEQHPDGPRYSWFCEQYRN